MLRWIQTKSIFPIAVTCFFFLFIVALIFKGQGFTDYNFALITVASFIFGIFISFTILNNIEKINKVNELLKVHDSNFLLLYKLIGEFDHTKKDACRELLDKHLIDEIDYRLVDFNLSAKSFIALYDWFIALDPKTDKQSVIYDKTIDVLNDTAKARQQVEVTTKQKISQYEWFSILTLLGVVIFLLLRLNEGGFLSALLTSVLILPMIVLTLVLQTLNNLRWQEGTQIWEPLHRLFLNLDLLPYYPDGVIELDRYKPSGHGKIRVAHYPHPYPDMSEKTIEMIDLNEL